MHVLVIVPWSPKQEHGSFIFLLVCLRQFANESSALYFKNWKGDYVCVYTCVYIYFTLAVLKVCVCVLQFQAHEGKKVSIVLCSAEPGTMQIKARWNEKLLKSRLKKTIVKRVEAFTALATKSQRNLNWRLSLKVRSCGKEGRLAGLDSRALQPSSACIKCPG